MFEKMKEIMSEKNTQDKPEGVFEYSGKESKPEEEEIELEIEREDMEDDDYDEPFEYSAENLGEFVNELKN